MAKEASSDICIRISRLREETFGPRGKSKFARVLGLSPSTYDYYENSRTPPAEILIRIAEVTGVDLQWLLTGREAETKLVSQDHPVLRRAAALLADCSDAAAPLEAFIELLLDTRKFPAKPRAAKPAPAEPKAATPRHTPAPPEPTEAQPGRDGWIPILGRTAAGVARFWGRDADTSGLTTLSDLMARHESWRTRSVQDAAVAESDRLPSKAVQVVTLSAPDENDVAEFVAAEPIKRAHPDAFVLRIDGDSMAPQVEHGDLVVLSPSEPALDGQAAVIQLAGQIGVTCKLYRTAGARVHLVPANGDYEIATVPTEDVEWALRVLARVTV